MSIAEQLEAKGIKKGVKKGIEKGVKKGRTDVAVTLLKDAVGELPETLSKTIAELDYELLLQLIRKATSFQSVEEIEDWLAEES